MLSVPRASQMYPMPNEMAEEEDEDIKQMKALTALCPCFCQACCNRATGRVGG